MTRRMRSDDIIEEYHYDAIGYFSQSIPTQFVEILAI